MQREGHTTLVAFSGQEDGYEIARRMKMVVPRTTLIAVTGYGLADDRAKSRKAGCAARLVKPVNIDAIEKVFSEFDPGPRKSEAVKDFLDTRLQVIRYSQAANLVLAA
jgi:CheY-like chemotaxis protein